jgi:hypothetical protein
MTMQQFNLGGTWVQSIGGREIDYVNIPGAFPPIGACTLARTFDLPWEASAKQRIFLVTEGVLARAAFVLNGQPIGEAGPWATYRFELPAGLLKPEGNLLQAHLRDLGEAFGPMPGRRFECGLPRAIYLERRPTVYLASMTFHAELSEERDVAHCSVSVEVDGQPQRAAHVIMAEQETGRVVAQADARPGQPAEFDVEWPRLWSPTAPNLYTLCATLPNSDSLNEQVGIRTLEARGHDFYLNGQRLVLKGVCRHEFSTLSGYAMPEAEVRNELARIKHAGFNYIRLVHSPHAPCVPRIAAELGLLVSEEPGTCWQDLSKPEIAAPAVECLMRTVQRDRNVPSVFAFLIYNECNPNVDYAVQQAQACRTISPGCLLGMADCSGQNDAIKAMVHAADLSFYGINCYATFPNEYEQRMAIFDDRPLVFTEWGGVLGQGNARQLKELCDGFVLHSQADEPLRLAGCSFWAWADYPEYSRPLPAAWDGWTIEGLTDQQAHPKPDLAILSQMCFDMDHPPLAPAPRVEVLLKAPRRDEHWQTVSLEAVTGDQTALEATIDQWRASHPRPSPWVLQRTDQPAPRPRFGRLLVDGIPFACRDLTQEAHPLLLGAGREEVLIPVNRVVRALAVLGHVTAINGYPYSTISSVFSAHPGTEPARPAGAPAAEYVFEFEDEAVTQGLRHGYEILRGNDICRYWMSAPRAAFTRPAVRCVVHPSFEVLRADLWERRFATPRFLRAIRWRLLDPEAILMLFGLSVEIAE